MKIACKKCGKLTDPLDISKKASYYNSKKEIVCWNCFQNELEKDDYSKG